jgi:hypothetical protein
MQKQSVASIIECPQKKNDSVQQLMLWTNVNGIRITRPRDADLFQISYALECRKVHNILYKESKNPTIKLTANGCYPQNITIKLTKNTPLRVSLTAIDDDCIIIKKNDCIIERLTKTLELPIIGNRYQRIQSQGSSKIQIYNQGVKKIIIPEKQRYLVSHFKSVIVNSNRRPPLKAFIKSYFYIRTHHQLFSESKKVVHSFKGENQANPFFKFIIQTTIEEIVVAYLDGITIKEDDTITIKYEKEKEMVTFTNPRKQLLVKLHTLAHPSNTVTINS